MTKKRKPGVKLAAAGKWNGEALTSMRETAFGTRAYFETKEMIERAERMRDDQALLDNAAAKRLRKLERNKRHG